MRAKIEVGYPMNGTMTVAVLAGGASSRMGRDKAMIRLAGQTFLQRIASVALSSGFDVLVIGRPQPADWTLNAVHFLLDDAPGLGPLGGILTALRYCNGDALVLGCDMPLLDSAAIRWLAAEAADAADVHGVVACSDRGPEPLFSVYRRRALSLIEEHIDRRQLAVRELLDAGSFAIADVPPELTTALSNINTSEQLNALLRQGGGR
jgi:molybdopterin-guanine dinucleotide biosynthesis protein A